MDHEHWLPDGGRDPQTQSDSPNNHADHSMELPKDQHDDSFLYTRMATLLDGITETGDIGATETRPDSEFASQADAAVADGNDPSTPADLTKNTENQPVSDSQISSFEPTAPTELKSGLFAGQAHVQSSSDATPNTAYIDHNEEIDSGAIRIKGRTDGVSIEIGDGDWHTLMVQLDARLEQAAGFFSGGQVILNLGGRTLAEAHLYQMRDVLTRYGLNPGMIRTTSNTTFEAALASGLAVTLEAGEDGERITAQQVESNVDFHSHYVYRGNLRSGQLLQRRESILVIGDVNPGAKLVSDGDIMVWGRLRGVAHAGASGAEESIIGALQFEPTQLRIGSLIAISPEQPSALSTRSGRQQSSPPTRLAYVVDERIIVSDWNEARRSGKSVLRR